MYFTKQGTHFYGSKQHSTAAVTLSLILTQKCQSQDKHTVYEFTAEAYEQCNKSQKKRKATLRRPFVSYQNSMS